MSIAIASITSGGNPVAGSACSAADFDIVQPTAINQDVNPGVTPFTTKGATIAMKNTNYNQNGCKSVTLNLSFTAA